MDDPAPASPRECAAGEAPLRLPRGERMCVAGDERDITIFGALHKLDGDWESHVRGYFERHVQPEWVCMDIGANIGTHTLSLAALATEGTVIAIEANANNFGYLKANVRRLPEPRATVLPVLRALWDEEGRLALTACDELAGCGFIAPETDPAVGEAMLRAANPNALAGEAVHLEMHWVPATRLDSWAADHDLERLDIVKIDVEGAEPRVLRGGWETLQRFKPLLITEYNPACAVNYFRESPEAYFHVLQELAHTIQIIEHSGEMSAPLANWDDLRQRLENGKGWEDLACVLG